MIHLLNEVMGELEVLLGREIFETLVSICFYGAPGEIQTPDLVVRSHALENALQPINTGIILLRTSHSILDF